MELLKGLGEAFGSEKRRQTAHTKAERWWGSRELTGVTLSGGVARGVTVRRGPSDGPGAPAGGEHRDSVKWPFKRSRRKAEGLSLWKISTPAFKSA